MAIPGDIWTRVSVSRSGRLAILSLSVSGVSHGPWAEESDGAFDEISLAGGNLYLGGAPRGAIVRAPVTNNFRGCVQKVRIAAVIYLSAVSTVHPIYM